MNIKRVLFVGSYPNSCEPHLNIFFKNLIDGFSDNGIDCVVISPISITKLVLRNKQRFKNIKSSIPVKSTDYTKKGNKITVYRPRFLSFSSKRFLCINTGYLSEKSFQRCALKCAKKIGFCFDAVYGHFIVGGGLAAIKIGRFFKKPSFFAYGESEYKTQVVKKYRDLKKRELVGISGIISVSDKNTSELQPHLFGIGVPIVTIPNAVDLVSFQKKDKMLCRKFFGMPSNAFIVGFVGSFIDRKGDKRLLEAVNMLPDVYVAYAGSGKIKPFGEKVLFCESLKHELICDFLNCADVFCLPTKNEGSCNAIIEAMACGVPVISSNLPFNDGILDNTNSIRVDPDSILEIKQAIIKLKESEHLRKRLSDGCLQAVNRFSLTNRTNAIIAFITAILNH